MTRGLLRLTLLTILLLAPLTLLDQGRCAETLRHEGDLILSGEEALVISDSVLEVTGGIYLRDNATLRLENVEGVEVSVERSAVEQVRSTGIGSKFKLKVSRSEIGEIDLEFCIVSLEVTESTIESLNVDNFWAKTSGINVSDSVIGTFKPGFGETTPIHYRFSNVTIRDSMGFKYGAFGDSGGAVIKATSASAPSLGLTRQPLTGTLLSSGSTT